MTFLISEYELIKQKKHPHFKYVKDFCAFNQICKANFHKFYRRFTSSNNVEDLLPQARGPKYNSRRLDFQIESAIIELRKRGNNKYEIYEILKKQFGDISPKPSTIYNILVKNNLNRKTNKMIEEKRKIIKTKLGELGHCDCHTLPYSIIDNNLHRYYFVAIIDSFSRAAWCEVVPNIQSLTVMFAMMRCFQSLKNNYTIQFEEILTDSGVEFGGGCKTKEAELKNPVKLLLHEMGIKHRHTKPYRPQTNGKIERFWRTISEDFIDGTTFQNEQELKDELYKYLIYYNEHRPHQAIGGKKPIDIISGIKK
jgi:hypothetical protein